MYYFSADHHFGHKNIIKYAKRPFSSIEEHDIELINRHNSVVKKDDTVIIIGDFSFYNKRKTHDIIQKLNGHLIFLKGSHDRWMKPYKNYHEVWNKYFIQMDNVIVCCHYQMKSWPISHYNSIQLYGHHHGKSTPEGKQMDVGVDTNNYYPYSLTEIASIMEDKPDNFNFIKN